MDDNTLPLCWKGRRPFKSLNDVRKYFKPIALSFANGGKAKTQFELPPEAYLIISVSPTLILLTCSFHFCLRCKWIIYSLFSFLFLTLTNIPFQRMGNVCLGIIDGKETGPLNIIGGNCWYKNLWIITFNIVSNIQNWTKPPLFCFIFLLFFCRHINARQDGDLQQWKAVDWMGACKLRSDSKV